MGACLAPRPGTTHEEPPPIGVGTLLVTPSLVDFGRVAPGDDLVVKAFALTNLDTAPVTITAVRVSGDAGFSLRTDRWTLALAPGPEAVPIPFEPLRIAPGDTLFLEATVGATAAGLIPARAEVAFMTDAAANGNASASLELVANGDAPCIEVRPIQAMFGGVTRGTVARIALDVANCGGRPLHVTALAVTPESSPAFALDPANTPAPFTIAPGTVTPVTVTYAPRGPEDRPGLPPRDVGTLRIESDATVPVLDVALSAWNADPPECPTAIIHVTEGRTVPVQTTLHLDGAQSLPSAGGEILGYRWSFLQPNGGTDRLRPSDEVAAPVFTPNMVGTYRFRLSVTDAAGTVSCVPAEVDVVVTTLAPSGIYVELAWHTPADVDETDMGEGLGSDLDLHVLHPAAHGAWMDPAFDAYSLNPSPNWGVPWTDDDPRLARDDTDGGGPEALALAQPQSGMQYRVGANYWNDWGYGPAYATVRVFLSDALAFETDATRLVDGDLWEVCTIDWPSGVVTPMSGATGGPSILPAFAGENRY